MSSVMPHRIERDALQSFLDERGLLVEVLPEEDYRWAHLPGVRNIPLEDLPKRAHELDRQAPVVVYCHDTVCDRSPRAATWLMENGFCRVSDYVAGKMDWIASDLPFEGEADLVGRHIRREVVTVGLQDPIGDVTKRRESDDVTGPVLVVADDGVLYGVAYEKALREADPGSDVVDVTSTGVSTVRPSEEVGPLMKRMAEAGIGRIVVTRLDGTPLGVFVASDVDAT